MSDRMPSWNGVARPRRAPAVPPVTPATRPPSPPVVAQALLAEYARLAAFDRRRRHLRRQILDRLEAGAAVEPGRLTAEVRTTTSRRLTVRKLAALIGADNVRVYMDHIEPSESVRLDVREAGGTSGRERGGRPASPGNTP